MMIKTAIIGAGASGLMAALSTGRDIKVTIFEKQDRVGKKLSQTGNGKCNISNVLATDSVHYFGCEFAEKIIKSFDVYKTIDFFKENTGLVIKREYGGRFFPYSGQANSVTDALRFAVANRSNIDLKLNCRITKVEKIADKFVLYHDGTKESFDKLIVCCGGMAGEKLGGCKDGYDILASFGHKISKIKPALTAIKTDTEYTKPLKGVRVDARAMLFSGDRLLRENTGDVMFTDYGLSGPAIMDVSRYCTSKGRERIVLDLVPEMTAEEVYESLLNMKDKRETVGELACGFLQNRLAMVIAKYAGFAPSMKSEEITEKELMRLAEYIKAFSFDVEECLGFAFAQVTRGGAELSGFDGKTLESKIVKGLFAAGEVLNVDGECGGFNLQWAWSSGYIAGRLGKTDIYD